MRQVNTGVRLSSSQIQQVPGVSDRSSQQVLVSGSSYSLHQASSIQSGGIRTGNYIASPIIVHRSNAPTQQ